MDVLVRKTGLAEGEIRMLIGILATNLKVVPAEEVRQRWDEAEAIVGSIDREDIPFVAAALASSCDAIWSDDKGLKRQKSVLILNTHEVLARLGGSAEG